MTGVKGALSHTHKCGKGLSVQGFLRSTGFTIGRDRGAEGESFT